MKKFFSDIVRTLYFSDKLSYIKASLLNTALGLSLMYGIYSVSQSKQASIFTANLLGYFVSIVNYNRIGFDRKSRPPYITYGVVYALTFWLNLFLTTLVMQFFKNFYLAQIFVVPVVAIFQWIALNVWVFKIIDEKNN